MDTRTTTAQQQAGADSYNQERLERLARETQVPILATRAAHKRPKGAAPERMDAEQFRGLQAELQLCVGARVLLTSNEWVEAGLVNGASGYVRGFMLPQKFDPNSVDTRLSTPLAIVVEFDEVKLVGPAREKHVFLMSLGGSGGSRSLALLL